MTVSSFNGRDKVTAFEALKAFRNTVQCFQLVLEGNVSDAMPIIENFIITMYNK